MMAAPRIAWALVLLGGCLSPAAAAEREDAFDFFAEEAKVLTASRRVQTVRESPVVVEVITAEDIKNSGVVNIWDLLRFRAGMDVFEMHNSLSGRRSVVSTRGLSGDFVDELQVLVDGRSVYEPVQSGVGWENLPVQLQDIERIEIVRGPNAVLYGSNSAEGVINIITKAPAKNSVSVRQTLGSLETRITEAAVESAHDAYGYRFSHTYKSNGGFPKETGGTANDFYFANNTNLRGYWRLRPDTRLELESGGSWTTNGLAMANDSKHTHRTYFNSLKLRHEQSADADLEARVSHSDTYMRMFPGDPVPFGLRFQQWDMDAMQQLGWLDGRMHTSVGFNYRHASMRSDQIFAGNPYQENRVVRGFVHDSFKFTDKLSFIAGVSAEHSDTGGWSPAVQAAAVLDPWTGHTFRASYAQANTIPSPTKKYANFMLTSGSQLVGNPGMVPDHLTSYEVAYIGSWLDRKLIPEVDLYYMTVTHKTEVGVTAPGLMVLRPDNDNNVIARGAEFKLRYDLAKGSNLYVNYTRQILTDVKWDEGLRQGVPVNKVNLGGVARLWGKLSASVNAGYKDGYRTTYTATMASDNQPAYWRLDAGLVYDPTPSLELFCSGQNLIIPRHREFNDSLMVPRTFYGGAAYKFGGS
ncbi:MAG: TonB-dependent receptor [Elusimicrobiota bacterium]|jgi:iron complex outermembrane receptor protein